MDIDDRDRRTGGFNNQPGRIPREIDNFSNIIAEFSPDLPDCEILGLVRKIESTLKRHGDNSNNAKVGAIVCRLISHPNYAIRKSAFASAVALLTNGAACSSRVLNDYRLTLLSSDPEIALHAMSVLQEFTKAVPDEAINLAQFAFNGKRNIGVNYTELERSFAVAALPHSSQIKRGLAKTEQGK